MRIVSLLPSATDIVCSLGLQEDLVGRTHECDWPPGVERVAVMTRDVLATAEMGSREIHEAISGAVHKGSSIYELDADALRVADPDLILTQELCEVCAVSYSQVDEATRMIDSEVKVVSLEPHTLEDVLGHIELVGELTGRADQAARVVEDLRRRLDVLRHSVAGRERRAVFCCEWLDPIFNGGHWVADQVEAAGGRDGLAGAGEASRVIEWERVVEASPEVLVLMPCGMPISRTVAELDLMAGRQGYDSIRQVWAVDGSSYFNRPGPRLVRGAEILAAILHGVGEVSGTEAVRIS
jgi:iron complex transport system substrate-binding protein